MRPRGEPSSSPSREPLLVPSKGPSAAPKVGLSAARTVSVWPTAVPSSDPAVSIRTSAYPTPWTSRPSCQHYPVTQRRPHGICTYCMIRRAWLASEASHGQNTIKQRYYLIESLCQQSISRQTSLLHKQHPMNKDSGRVQVVQLIDRILISTLCFFSPLVRIKINQIYISIFIT